VLNSESVSFSAAAAPLVATFGDRLTLRRDGNRVRWGCDGQSVIVEMLEDGGLDATFVDRAGVDEVTGRFASAVYRRNSGIAYRLTADGATRMIGDMTAFSAGPASRCSSSSTHSRSRTRLSASHQGERRGQFPAADRDEILVEHLHERFGVGAERLVARIELHERRGPRERKTALYRC
jgi:hypothetical protein